MSTESIQAISGASVMIVLIISILIYNLKKMGR